MLDDLRPVKALMTTEGMATIEDASNTTWHLSGSDLLVLAAPSGKIMAVHANAKEIGPATVQEALIRSIHLPANNQWWFLDGHLYEVFFQPPFFVRSGEDRLLAALSLRD